MDRVRRNYVTILQWLANSNIVSVILSGLAGRHVGYKRESKDLGSRIKDSEYMLS